MRTLRCKGRSGGTALLSVLLSAVLLWSGPSLAAIEVAPPCLAPKTLLPTVTRDEKEDGKAREKSAPSPLVKAFEHDDGVALVPVLWTLYQSGILRRLPKYKEKAISLSELGRQSGAVRGYLGVVMRALASQGWLTWETAPILGNEEEEQWAFRLTPEGEVAMEMLHTHEDAYKKVNGFMKNALDMDKALFGSLRNPKISRDFNDLLERSKKQWDIPEESDPLRAKIRQQIVRHLDGALIGPTVVALWLKETLGSEDEETGRVGLRESIDITQIEGNPENLRIAFEFLSAQGWVEKRGNVITFTDDGKRVLSRPYVFGVPVSYLPTYRLLPQLLFSNDPPYRYRIGKKKYREIPQGLDTRGIKELLVNRRMNVRASGAAHKAYVQVMKEQFQELFDNEDFENQPPGIMDTGCGDGTMLRELYEFVRDHTARGKVLDEYPLRIVGVDFYEEALDETTANLQGAGIPHITVQGNIQDPGGIEEALKSNPEFRKWGLGMRDFKHVRSFLDHNRPWNPLSALVAGVRSSSSGAFAHRGSEVTNELLEADLVEHFKRWAPYIGRFGLSLNELHTIHPTLAARLRGKSLAVPYDVSHGLSDQYIVEWEVFLRAVHKAGLEVVFKKLIPPDAPTVSISRLVARKERPPVYKQGNTIYFLPDGSRLERITDPGLLPEDVRAYWDDHHALVVIRNEDLGYTAYLGMHRTVEKDGVSRTIGGTAMEAHRRPEGAMIEALLLSRQMSYKSALIPGLDVYGGKFVIDYDNQSITRRDVLASAAAALEWMAENLKEGIFTGQDVNISKPDARFMVRIAPSSIAGVKSVPGKVTYEPTPPTAIGVMAGLQAVAEEVFHKEGLKGLRVSLAGLGNVGSLVLEGLLEQGAIVHATELYAAPREAMIAKYADAIATGQLVVSGDVGGIYDIPADIFCPCTSERRILVVANAGRLKKAGVKAIAGSSNTQLFSEDIAGLLHEWGIVYVEDVVINAGGLMAVEGRETAEVQRVIYDNVKKILRVALSEGQDPHEVFKGMATARVQGLGVGPAAMRATFRPPAVQPVEGRDIPSIDRQIALAKREGRARVLGRDEKRNLALSLTAHLSGALDNPEFMEWMAGHFRRLFPNARVNIPRDELRDIVRNAVDILTREDRDWLLITPETLTGGPSDWGFFGTAEDIQSDSGLPAPNLPILMRRQDNEIAMLAPFFDAHRRSATQDYGLKFIPPTARVFFGTLIAELMEDPLITESLAIPAGQEHAFASMWTVAVRGDYAMISNPKMRQQYLERWILQFYTSEQLLYLLGYHPGVQATELRILVFDELLRRQAVARGSDRTDTPQPLGMLQSSLEDLFRKDMYTDVREAYSDQALLTHIAREARRAQAAGRQSIEQFSEILQLMGGLGRRVLELNGLSLGENELDAGEVVRGVDIEERSLVDVGSHMQQAIDKGELSWRSLSRRVIRADQTLALNLFLYLMNEFNLGTPNDRRRLIAQNIRHHLEFLEITGRPETQVVLGSLARLVILLNRELEAGHFERLLREGMASRDTIERVRAALAETGVMLERHRNRIETFPDTTLDQGDTTIARRFMATMAKLADEIEEVQTASQQIDRSQEVQRTTSSAL